MRWGVVQSGGVRFREVRRGAIPWECGVVRCDETRFVRSRPLRLHRTRNHDVRRYCTGTIETRTALLSSRQLTAQRMVSTPRGLGYVTNSTQSTCLSGSGGNATNPVACHQVEAWSVQVCPVTCHSNLEFKAALSQNLMWWIIGLHWRPGQFLTRVSRPLALFSCN